MIKLQAKQFKSKLNYLKGWMLLAILVFGVGVANAVTSETVKLATVSESVSYNGLDAIKGVEFNTTDNFVDVIVHSEDGAYVIYIDKTRFAVDENTLASIIKERTCQ